jgi:hypothetical protein
MTIELRKLSEIKPYPGNPRLNDEAVDAVAQSIRAFEFRQPVVVVHLAISSHSGGSVIGVIGVIPASKSKPRYAFGDDANVPAQ